MNTQQQNIETVIVGLGTTGLSVARYFAKQDSQFAVVDSRENPPSVTELFALQSEKIPHYFGGFDTNLLKQAKQLVVNPGVSVKTKEIVAAKKSGAEVIGDIELFVRGNEKNTPVIAITGSNGKTTVTTLLDLMAQESGGEVATGGNIGLPALDLLSEEDAELFILELSSYQLETTPSLKTLSAIILNVSEDHLDRYENDIEQYALAKALIYKNCKHLIFNREDAYSSMFSKIEFEQSETAQTRISFGLDEPQQDHYGIRKVDGEEWLAKGTELLLKVAEVKQVGRHNIANSLAALALGETANLSLKAMLTVLRNFTGMDHRTQLINTFKGIKFYNDSKGTNVGATLSALSGLSGKTVLIAGGQGKGADFLPLSSVMKNKARAVVLFGEDANKIAAVIDESIPHKIVNSMQEAVSEAYAMASSDDKDNVLLSPACASFDMFENYIQRGLAFVDEVKALKAQLGGNHV